MLTLNAVHKSRGTASQRYSLVIPRLHLRGGEQLAVVGPSGCGKSTLLDLLALVLAPDQAGQFDFTPANTPLDIAKLWRGSQQGPWPSCAVDTWVMFCKPAACWAFGCARQHRVVAQTVGFEG